MEDWSGHIGREAIVRPGCVTFSGIPLPAGMVVRVLGQFREKVWDDDDVQTWVRIGAEIFTDPEENRFLVKPHMLEPVQPPAKP